MIDLTRGDPYAREVSHDCPVKTIQTILGYAASVGVSPPELLAAAGIDPALLAHPDGYLLEAQEIRIWDEAVRRTGDLDFGLHLAEWVAQIPEDHFDVLTFAVRSSPTLAAHYRLAGRYIRLIHEGVHVTLEEDGNVGRLVHGHAAGRIGPRHPMEGMMALSLLLGRQTVGEDLVPQEVRFAHPRPERVSEQERLFRAPVHYGCSRNELVLTRAFLDRPQRDAQEGLLAYLDRQLGGILSALPTSRRYRDVVKCRMMDELPEREPVVASIAAKLRVSTRSLQRRLQSEGTSFAELLAELRHELALRYLQDPRLSICEVAFLLGFLDVTAFHRAFKRWTGKTPAEHRRQLPLRKGGGGLR